MSKYKIVSANNGIDFANNKKYSVDYIMNLYEQHLLNNDQFIIDNIHVYSNEILRFAYKIYKDKGEIRCPLCQTVCSHFRIIHRQLYPYCFRKSKYEMTTYYTFFNIDHIVPKSKNGENISDNKTLVCARCNLLKGDAVDNTKYLKQYQKAIQCFDNILGHYTPKKEYRYVWNTIVKHSKKEYTKLFKERYNRMDKNGNFNFKGI